MTLPANLRTNVLLPFPAQVMGNGPVSIAKQNGIWTISLAASGLQQQSPVGTQLNNDLLLVWDSIVGNWFTVPMSFFSVGGGTGGMAAAKQRSITSGPVTIAPDDEQLNLNLGAPTSITLPGYAARNGVGLVFKDVGMQATANPITLVAAAGETIDGLASTVLDVNGESIAITPANDGLNTGWFQI